MAITLVQHAQGSASSQQTITVTLGAGTTAGNCLVVAVGAVLSVPTITGITLGASAGNFAQDVAVTNSTAGIQPIAAAVWSDPNCAGGQTTVTVTFSGSSVFGGADVYEVSGLLTSSVTDKTASSQGGNTSGTTFDSTATATTTVAAEFWAGACAAISATSGNAAETPGAGWTAETQINLGSLTGVRSAYQIASSTGAADYSGTISPASWWSAAVATYKGVAAATPAPFFPARQAIRIRAPRTPAGLIYSRLA